MKELLVFNIQPLSIVDIHIQSNFSTAATLETVESGHCGEVAVTAGR